VVDPEAVGGSVEHLSSQPGTAWERVAVRSTLLESVRFATHGHRGVKMQMGLAGGIAPQEDGTHWIVVTWTRSGRTVHVQIPRDAAAALGEAFPSLLPT